MTDRPIRIIGDPILRTRCDVVTSFDAGLRSLVDDLLEGVQQPGRAGLAANQIGVGLAVFSYLIGGDLGYVINPVVVETAGDYEGPEGCLSVPGMTFDRLRFGFAAVEGVDIDQNPIRVEGTEEMARVLQHETDHLVGKFYIDGLEGPERREALRRIRSMGLG